MMDLPRLMSLAQQAADFAAGHIQTHSARNITAKGDRDMASDVDFTIEHTLREFFLYHTPDIGFFGEEEGGSSPDEATTWLLDPVDGTANFVRDIPLCAASIALAHEGRPILGAISLPYLRQRYWASEGGGAWYEEDLDLGSVADGAIEASPNWNPQRRLTVSETVQLNDHKRPQPPLPQLRRASSAFSAPPTEFLRSEAEPS
jgi:fructose-1,6-bisphosphatase/inositol monophosphatase family enzyme